MSSDFDKTVSDTVQVYLVFSESAPAPIAGKPYPLRAGPNGGLMIEIAAGSSSTGIEEEPAREPKQHLVTVPASDANAANLGTTATETCDGGWDLIVPVDQVDIFIGTSSEQLRPLVAGVPFYVPSSTLTGWYVKSSGAASQVIATGAKKT